MTLSDVHLENAGVGFAAYQKKSEFGPGRLSISRMTAKAVSRLFAIERRSALTLDGRALEADQHRVAEQLYPPP